MNRLGIPSFLLAFLLGVSGFLTAGLALGADKPIGNSTGEQLHNEFCSACHIRMTGGDGSALYIRHDSKIGNLDELKARVGYCSQQIGQQWNEETIMSVSEYLNQHWYHLKD
jgi:mono/diheme cytochrome c family protein